MSVPTTVFVTPWYGADLTGGAERECRRTAEEAALRGLPVEVVTTCVRSFESDWGRNYHAPGTSEINGVTVRRFRVRRRDGAAFKALNNRLLRGEVLSPEDQQRFMREMIGSPDLLTYLRSRRDDCRFVFIPYMFATTYWGAQVDPARSFVIPCLHDEPYARLPLFESLMPRLRGFILHSRQECALMRSLYAVDEERLHLVGEGVDDRLTADGARFRRDSGIGGRFLLYVGRRDGTKNLPLLLDYFARYKMENCDDLSLALAGQGPLPQWARAHPDMHDCGVLGEQAKVDAQGAALCLVQPSLNESFSLVLMESWLAGRPALVHADCAVTAGHCRASHGGLEFRDYGEFAATVRWMRDHPEAASQMGAQGRAYVRQNFGWDDVVKRLVHVVHDTPAS